jgi:hypothetical protein
VVKATLLAITSAERSDCLGANRISSKGSLFRKRCELGVGGMDSPLSRRYHNEYPA